MSFLLKYIYVILFALASNKTITASVALVLFVIFNI